MKTYMYVDAFNLYFGCVKGTPHKWLDLSNRSGMWRLDPAGSPSANPIQGQLSPVFLKLLTQNSFRRFGNPS